MGAGGIVSSYSSISGRLMAALARRNRPLAVVVSAAVAGSLVVQAPALAAKPWSPPKPPEVTGISVAPVVSSPRPTWTATGREVRGDRRVSWPRAATVTVDLGVGGAAEPAAGLVKAGDLPVFVSASSVGADGRDPGVLRPGAAVDPGVSRLGLRVHDREMSKTTGVDGLLLAVSRADGVAAPAAATVEVDYRGFADAYGGDWASRLRLVKLPACALSAPELTECSTATALRSTNNASTLRVSADVSLAASGEETLLALSAGPSGDNGDYTATSLSPASTWQVSAQTGDFSWSYPIRVPPAVNGPEPSLGLSYSSSSIDGRTGSSNTQGSWIGDGWDMWPGYIERRYRTCSEDRDPVSGQDPNNKNQPTGDQCWFNSNATMSLNGRGTELARGADGRWRGVSDDGSRVELLANPGFANGDNDNEYWKVTTVDGTQYFFGGRSGTSSVWTVPVYGNHPGEPCHADTFNPGHCSQAWRWNLDHVVDPHGNTMTYSYTPEEGAYGRENNPGLRSTYHRGGWLRLIEYGTRTGSSAPAAARVALDPADRCAPGATCSPDVESAWPDVPWDQYCDPGTQCTDQRAPTFWTQKRLSKIRTEVWNAATSSYQPVESYTLRHEFLDAGEVEGKPMWLRGIVRTGHVGPAVSDPEIVFNPGFDAAENRVDGPSDNRSKLARFRMRTLTTETGAQIGVEYAPLECTRTSLPAPHANTKRCFPQYYAPAGQEPTLDWFHKYVVKRLDVYDNTGGFGHEQTNYDYLDTPAWHYDDSELVPEKKRTWGQYRGYGRVQERKGFETGVQSATEHLFLRGMDGDKQPTGVRDVWVTDSQGVRVEDHEAYNGMTRETTVYNGPGGAWVSGTINDPWRHGPTATSGPLKAWITNIGTSRNRTALEGGGTRWTKTVTRFHTDNLLPYELDDLGDEATAEDDKCVRTEYVRNVSTHMLDKVSRTETVGAACTSTPARPADVLSDVRNYYDTPTAPWGTAPTKGDLVRTEEVDSWSGSTPLYVTTVRSVYDANGRVTEAYDALDRRTATAYTPALAGPVTRTVVGNPLGQAVTTTMEPWWQLPRQTVDPNGHRTDLTYDALGRLLKVWLPGRDKATQTPNLEFGYDVRATAPTAVTTKKLLPSGAGYKTSITLYDAHLRERQTQTQAPGGGRVITDTVHDSRGLADWTSKAYYDKSGTAPNKVLYTPTEPIPGVTKTVYDGAERQTAAIFKALDIEKWRTTTAHGGDRTHVTPPIGGTATTTITDGRDRTVELRQYRNHAGVGSNDPATFDATRYTHTDRDELATVVDAAGNTWRYTYDQRGRTIRQEDPDKGTSTMTHDRAGQLVTTTDARGVTVATTYDALGRKTSLRDGSVTGPKRAEWVYDTLLNGIGKQTRSTRYEPAGSTTGYVNEVTGYDTAGRPTGTKVTIPASETGLCAAAGSTPCEYSYATTYKPDGQTYTSTMPAVGDLGPEKLIFSYNDVGAPTTVDSALSIYVYAVTYNKLGELTQRQFGNFGKRTALTYIIDEPTGRLANSSAVPEQKNEIFDLAYKYDDAGNLTRIADTPNGGQAADYQCYGYDHLRRLKDAWTPASDSCPTAPTVAGLGGPARYWHSYTYDTTGNRLSETRHATTNTTATYAHPAAGAARPHAVSSVTTTSGGTSTLDTFEYDNTGNTTKRVVGGSTQTLTWNPEGNLATVTAGGQATSYVYDADGDRLVRRDATGKTLYLPGGTELRYTAATGAKNATRYYTHVDATVAVRTASALTWMVTDHHNTGEAAVRNTDLSVARRRILPFGDLRGSAPSWWAGDKGFVGGTVDNTGLTHLGAREYDPKFGRFISIDPVVDHNDPQTLHGYAYANNAPPTSTDPDGLLFKSLWNKASNVASKAVDVVGNAVTTAATGVKNFAVDTYKTVKEDPLKFAAELAVGIAVAVAVGAVCATGVGCVILAGAVAGAAAAGAAYGVDVAQGDREFDAGDLATEMVVGGVVGGATAGLGHGLERGLGKLIPGRTPKECSVNSFVPGSAVAMADGSHKPIEEVQLGDQVAATDPGTGQTRSEQVVATITGSGDKQLVDVTIDSGEEADTITATGNHPFWVANRAEWVDALSLRPGDQLLAPDGSRVRVLAIAAYGAAATVHNLTISDIHTYYVLSGDTPVLVHNCGGKYQGKHRAEGDSSQPDGWEPLHLADPKSHHKMGPLDWLRYWGAELHRKWEGSDNAAKLGEAAGSTVGKGLYIGWAARAAKIIKDVVRDRGNFRKFE